jgi:hypothetical protein
LKPSRLLRAFRRRLFARARKLKPIGIGIAALLAISLSYVGVKALTKPQVKPPMIIAQPSPAVPQPIAPTSETEAPKIVTTTETEPPTLTSSPSLPEAAPSGAPQNQAAETEALTLTNPPRVPEAAQNGAPPNQSPETAALTLTNPATAPDATQNVAPLNQDAIGNAGAAQKQDPAAQSTLHTQPGQPQIAAKPEQENPSNASRGTRSGDASPPEHLEQEVVPQFPWPPPKASASATIPRELLVGNAAHPMLGTVAQSIESAFQEAGYGEKSHYGVPGGFALASQIERINQDGSPKDSIDRWSLETPPVRKVSLAWYLNALFLARPGYYRVIVFVVTSKAFPQRDVKVTSEQSKRWVKSGLNKLPEQIGNQEYSSAHRCTALIYEFKRTGTGHAEFVDPSEITGQIHLEKSGLLAAFAKRR